MFANPADLFPQGGETAVEIARRIAREIWRGERARQHRPLGGLVCEAVLRARLEKMTRGRPLYARIDFEHDRAIDILDASERVLTRLAPGPFASEAALLDRASPELLHAIDVVIVQCIGGRLGLWASRGQESDDARIARSLQRRAEASTSSLADLLVAGDQHFKNGWWLQSIVCFFDADRVARSPLALVKTSLALWKAEQYEAALWTIRCCLLEPVRRFEDPSLLYRAHRIEGSLARLVERRGVLARELFGSLPADAAIVLPISEPAAQPVPPAPQVGLRSVA